MKIKRQNSWGVRQIGQSQIDILKEAMLCSKVVRGLIHNFYRYPARFSPQFAAAAIEAFSNKGDLILDPFMGGGTTIVEASARGRFSIGTDINELAVFVSKAKTTIISNSDVNDILKWCNYINGIFKLNRDLKSSPYNNDDYYCFPSDPSGEIGGLI
jgi:hypothetical protein